MEELISRELIQLGNINKETISIDLLNRIKLIKEKTKFMCLNKHYDANYFISVFLTLPFILLDLRIDDWKVIVEHFSPRKLIDERNPFKGINDDKDYSDLIFLNKYLKINPFDFLFKYSKLNNEEINKCVIFAKTYSFKFFVDEEELKEDLDTFYNITKVELEIYSKELITQGFVKGFINEDEMINYLNNESFYVEHPNGGFVQFENLSSSSLQDGKMILQPNNSFYHVYDKPPFLRQKVLDEAIRQVEAASAKNLTVEWLVSDQKALTQLTQYFSENNVNAAVKFFAE